MNAFAGTHVSRHYWWTLVVRGVLALIFGLAALVWPGLTLFVLVILFGVYALLDGVMAIIVAIEERRNTQQMWVLLLVGIVGIAAGVLTLVWPAITALALLYVIAGWAIVTGILQIASLFSGRLPVGREWMVALSGVL